MPDLCGDDWDKPIQVGVQTVNPTLVPGKAQAAHAAMLVEHLRCREKLADPHLPDVFMRTPRDVFIRSYYERCHPQRRCRHEPGNPGSVEDWLATVYAPSRTLVTALSPDGDLSAGEVVSSSASPEDALRMLEVLRLRDDMRILEIGSGTGYVTALLCARLGDRQVTAIDIDPDLTAQAQTNLAELHQMPTLLAGDGFNGVPDGGPFDRIVVSCAFDDVSAAWIEHTRHGATVLTHLRSLSGAGIPVSLWRREVPALQGRVQSAPRACVASRLTFGDARRRREQPVAHDVRASSTVVNPAELDGRTPFALVAQLLLPPGTAHSVRLDASNRPASCLTAPDGSWAEISRTADGRGQHDVLEAGPQSLIESVEAAWTEWTHLDRRRWTDFGLTVTPDSTVVWHRNPTSGAAWPVPRVQDD